MSDALPALALADSLWPEDLVRLADLEVRSRDAAPFAYSAAVAEFERLAALIEQTATIDRIAWRIALRLWPDETRETIVRHVLTRVALVDLLPVSPETRMYLGRGWRQWRKGLASS